MTKKLSLLIAAGTLDVVVYITLGLSCLPLPHLSSGIVIMMTDEDLYIAAAMASNSPYTTRDKRATTIHTELTIF